MVFVWFYFSVKQDIEYKWKFNSALSVRMNALKWRLLKANKQQQQQQQNHIDMHLSLLASKGFVSI
jgi:hypothetical protein